jgi:ribonuclease P protein component
MRLLKRVEYEAVYGAGQRRSSSQFSVFFRAQSAPLKEAIGQNPAHAGSSSRAPESQGAAEASGTSEGSAESLGAARASRFGISVKKALGGAVIRNRIRRRIREILRRNRTEIPSGWDIVIHPRSSVARAEFAPLEAELVRLLRGIQNSAPKAKA